MRASGPVVLLVLAALGCAHAKTTDGESKPTEATSTGANGGEPHDRASELPRKPGHPPVSTHAEDLLKPGAEDKIRRKLVAGHYLSGGADTPIAGGLRKFQEEKNLPATGIPDHETIRRLGLDPADIFR
jgi:hypothetical protein